MTPLRLSRPKAWTRPGRGRTTFTSLKYSQFQGDLSMTNAAPQMSQKTAFLIFLAVVMIAAPVLYAYIAFSGRFFTASPDWWATWLVPTAIAAIVLAVASIPLFRKLGAPWATKFGGFLCVMGVVAGLMLWYVPMLLTFMVRSNVSWPATVASTQRSGKDITCGYPFSIDEISQGFCAASAEAYSELRVGRKIEVVGLGRKYGIFIEGYRLAE